MVTPALTEMLSRNKKNAQSYQSPPDLLQLLPGFRQSRGGVIVICCSDPRLNVSQMLGLDAKLRATMILNAGGRVFDAIRSVVLLQNLATPGAIVVIHHTDCGVTHTSDAEIRKELKELAPQESSSIETMKFGEIKNSIEESVREDVELLKASPLIKKDIQIIGLKFDIKTGLLENVD